MSTKLSLLSRAAAVAGILAISLPAFADTTQPAPGAPAASKPVTTSAKSDKNKPLASHKKPAKHVAQTPAQKPMVNTAATPATTKTNNSTAPVNK